MKGAKLIKVKLGITQTYIDEDTIDFGFKIANLNSLHDKITGGIFKRNYSGVEMPRPGYVINACMKLLYCFDNAQLVKDLIMFEAASRDRANSRGDLTRWYEY